MKYSIMYFDETGTKMYCTNTKSISGWTDNIENAATVLRYETAKKLTTTMYKNGAKNQLHVVELVIIPTKIESIAMPEKKTGFVIIDSSRDLDKQYYYGPRNSSSFGYNLFANLEKATTFVTEKEALKTLELYHADHLNFAMMWVSKSNTHRPYMINHETEVKNLKVIEL